MFLIILHTSWIIRLRSEQFWPRHSFFYRLLYTLHNLNPSHVHLSLFSMEYPDWFGWGEVKKTQLNKLFCTLCGVCFNDAISLFVHHINHIIPSSYVLLFFRWSDWWVSGICLTSTILWSCVHEWLFLDKCILLALYVEPPRFDFLLVRIMWQIIQNFFKIINQNKSTKCSEDYENLNRFNS